MVGQERIQPYGCLGPFVPPWPCPGLLPERPGPDPVTVGVGVAAEGPAEGPRLTPPDAVRLGKTLGLGEATGDDPAPAPTGRPVTAPPGTPEAVGDAVSPTAGAALSSLPCTPPEGAEEDPTRETPTIRATTTPPATNAPLRGAGNAATSPHTPADDRRPLPRLPAECFRREGLSAARGGTYASSTAGGISRVSSYALSHPCATAGSAYSSYEGAGSGCGWYTFGGP